MPETGPDFTREQFHEDNAGRIRAELRDLRLAIPILAARAVERAMRAGTAVAAVHAAAGHFHPREECGWALPLYNLVAVEIRPNQRWLDIFPRF